MGEGLRDPQDQRVQRWAGLGAGPGKWGEGGLGKTWPSTALKTTPVYLGAGQETYWLPLPPSQTVGSGGGEGVGLGLGPLPSRISSRWGSAQGGVLSSLSWRGNPQSRP